MGSNRQCRLLPFFCGDSDRILGSPHWGHFHHELEIRLWCVVFFATGGQHGVDGWCRQNGVVIEVYDYSIGRGCED